MDESMNQEGIFDASARRRCQWQNNGHDLAEIAGRLGTEVVVLVDLIDFYRQTIDDSIRDAKPHGIWEKVKALFRS